MRQHKLKKIAVAAAFALSGAAFMAPGAYAAGLGQLTVLSGLGQPLRAEIDLTSVTRQEAATLAGKMAGPEAYQQAGVEMSPAMLGVRVTVNRRPSGSYFLSLTTVQPVNDPFIDALIEVNWASGRLVREYTFLLDPADLKVNPPVAAERPRPAVPAPVEPPRVAEAPRAAEPPQPAAEAPKPAEPAAAAAPDAVKPADASQPAGTGATYAVKNGDTLAKVAAKNPQEGVSLDQMLVALYRGNQDSFIGANINRLKSGVILNLPSKDAATAVAPDDARRLIVAQSADWKSYQGKLAAGVEAAPATKSDAPKQASQGRITAKVEDQAQKAEARDQLRLSKADLVAAKSDGKKAGGAAPKPRASEEELIAKERALKDANARVAELEKNVRDLQKLVEVKNQNLADLQRQAQARAAEAKRAPEPAKVEPPKALTPPVVAKAPEPAKVEPPKVEPPKVEPPKVEPAKAPEPVKAPEPPKAVEPPKAAEAAAEPPKAAEAPKAAETAAATTPAPGAEPAKAGDAPKVDGAVTPPPAAAEPPKVAEAPKTEELPKAAPKKAAPPPPPPEPSLMDELLGNPLYLGGVGLVIVALGAYAAIAVRRKRKVESFESSIITGGDLKANSVFGNTGGQSVDTGNSSFQSDFSQVGPGAIDADEVDPVAEADVYMAYGRDAQAEEILKEALQKDPNRHTVRMKLLEIYSQRRDPKAFESAATDLYSATGGQGEQWHRAAALGQQVDPSNPLYGGSGAAPAARNTTTTTVTLGGGAMAAAAAAAAAAPPVAPAGTMDFSGDKTVTLESFGVPAYEGGDDPLTKTLSMDAFAAQPAPADINLDFDLGGASSPRAPASAPDFMLGDGGPNTEPDASVDFDLGFGDAPAAAPQKAAAPVTDFSPSGTLIIDAPNLSAFGTAEKTIEMTPTRIPDAPTDLGGNDIDFDFDVGTPPSAPAAAAPAGGNGMDFDLSSISLELPSDAAPSIDSGAMDDAATKLDLAKAYHEMGDKDGAKELLSEVLKEGSAMQQAEAQQLLASI